MLISKSGIAPSTSRAGSTVTDSPNSNANNVHQTILSNSLAHACHSSKIAHSTTPKDSVSSATISSTWRTTPASRPPINLIPRFRTFPKARAWCTAVVTPLNAQSASKVTYCLREGAIFAGRGITLIGRTNAWVERWRIASSTILMGNVWFVR